MINLKKFQDMDRRQGRPEQMPGGSGFFGKMDLDDDEPHPTMRPPMELPSSHMDDHEDDDEFGMEDESKFDQMVHKLDKDPDVHDPDALAAAIGRRKYGPSKFQKMSRK